MALGVVLAAHGVASAQDQGHPVINANSIDCASGKPEKMLPACTRILHEKGRTPVDRAIALRN